MTPDTPHLDFHAETPGAQKDQKARAAFYALEPISWPMAPWSFPLGLLFFGYKHLSPSDKPPPSFPEKVGAPQSSPL